MISQLISPAITLCLMLFVPGYCMLRLLRLPRAWSLSASPIVSIGLVSLLGELLGILDIPATPTFVFLPIVIPLVTLLALQSSQVNRKPLLQQNSTPHRRNEQAEAVRSMPDIPPAIPWWAPAAFAAMGLLVCNSVFLSKLDSPNAVLQAYDVTHHLNTIQAFYESRSISSFGVCPYLTTRDASVMPYGVVATYPSAWYALCALVMQVTGVSAPVAINASMVVFASIVLPLGVLCWASVVFPDEPSTVLSASLTCVAFATFPWCMLLFGPLYPNLAGFVSLPATSALFMLLVRQTKAGVRTSSRAMRLAGLIKARGPYAAVFFISLVGQALLHPNTVFSLFLFFVPYCVWRVYDYCLGTRSMKTLHSVVFAGLFAALCLGFWVACFLSPAFSAITGEYWPGFAYSWQEVINILTQTYVLAFFSEISAQVALGALVVIGWVRCAHDKKLQWLAISYLVVCIVNFVGATSFTPTIKQFFAGFWYTDAMRLAAMACLLASLLAAHGFSWTVEAACALVKAYNDNKRRRTRPRLIAASLAALFLILNYMPGFNWPGAHSDITPSQFDELKRSGREYDTVTVRTTFGDYRQLVRDYYDRNTPIDEQEREFLEEVAQIVPSDALIINNPMDGSFLAYGGMGLRVYYREFGYAGSSTETSESLIVRTQLNEIATNPAVRDAVDAIGANYVLVLNEQNSSSSFINLRGDYSHRDYAGISSISPDTPGFTPLLTNGACTLYAID